MTNNLTVFKSALWSVELLRKRKLFIGATDTHRAQRYACFFDPNLLKFLCLLSNHLLGHHSVHLLHPFCFLTFALFLSSPNITELEAKVQMEPHLYHMSKYLKFINQVNNPLNMFISLPLAITSKISKFKRFM